MITRRPIAQGRTTAVVAVLVLFIGLMIYLLPKLWRGIKKVFGWILVKLGVGARPANVWSTTTRPRKRG